MIKKNIHISILIENFNIVPPQLSPTPETSYHNLHPSLYRSFNKQSFNPINTVDETVFPYSQTDIKNFSLGNTQTLRIGIQHKLIGLMKNEIINLFFLGTAFIQQLPHQHRNSFKVKIKYRPTIHIQIIILTTYDLLHLL